VGIGGQFCQNEFMVNEGVEGVQKNVKIKDGIVNVHCALIKRIGSFPQFQK
jgi:hypothetical protein